MTQANKPNTSYWIVAVIALIWNGMGVMSYLGSVYMTEEIRAQYTAEQLAVMDSAPAWLTGVYALAVFLGLLGALLLLLKRRLAIPVFGVSLLMVLVQMIYSWLATDSIAAFGTLQGIVMPLMLIAIAIFLYYYSKGAAAKGWLK